VPPPQLFLSLGRRDFDGDAVPLCRRKLLSLGKKSF